MPTTLYNALGVPPLITGAFPMPAPTPPAGGPTNLPQAQKLEWGIYPAGGSAKILEPDSIIAVEYRREWALAGYPIEGGSFLDYNKVARPFELRLRLTKGGTVADRKTFRDALEKICASLDLYDIVTPDTTYSSVNVTHLGLAQSSQNGISLLTFEIGLQQVRTTPEGSTAAASAVTPADIATQQAPVAAPAAAPTTNVGTVRPQTTPAPVQRAAQAALSGQAPEATVFSDTVGPL